jgi:hypothetical protein
MVDRLNKDGVINLLKIMNTGHSEHLQRRIQSRMNALAWVENEIKMKENYLNSLDNRIREFSYREGDIIPMTNSSANELTHGVYNMYPPLPDATIIRPIPCMWDMQAAQQLRSINDLTSKIFDAQQSAVDENEDVLPILTTLS